MGGQRVGALGGARAATRAHTVWFTGRTLDNSEFGPAFRTWQPLKRGGTLAALPHRAQSSVRVNASLRCGASCTFILSLQRHGRKNQVCLGLP